MLALLFFSPLLLSLTIEASSPPIDRIAQNISIQTSNQTFYSYIPLSSECTYPTQPSVQLGRLDYTPLDPPAIFDALSLTAETVFWSPLINGLRMQLDSTQLLSNSTYVQVVLFNSSISQNLTQRQLILTSFTSVGDITFNYADPVYNYSSNTLTAILSNSYTFALGKKIAKIVRDCKVGGNYIWITYVGGDSFVGVCPNTTDLFIWNINNSTEPYVYDSLSFLGGSNIQNITNEPTLLFPQVPNYTIPAQNNTYDWNMALLLQDGTSAFFCQANSTDLSCDSYQHYQNWLSIVIERGWGFQASLQLSEIQLILTQFPQLLNQTFPGNIVSMFSYSDTLFVESASQGTTYLCIFEQGHILANTSLSGQIIYYGREKLIVEQPNGSFSLVEFILPMYQIVHEEPQQNNQSLNVSCTYATYELVYDIIWSNIAFPMYLVQQLPTVPSVSYQSVKVANLNDFFMIIGPAFNLFIELDAAIDITLLDISELLGINQIMDVVSVLFTEGNGQAYVPYLIIFLDERGVLKQHRIGSHLPALSLAQPCSMDIIKQSFTLRSGFVFTSADSICYCDKSINNCQIISHQSLPGIVAQQTDSLGEYSFTISSIIAQISPLSPPPSPNAVNPIKKQLLAVVNQDLIVNIYQNNTITLTNFQGQAIDSISPICLNYNTTDGTIFMRNFYDDFLLLYCYGGTTITQYLIRSQQLVFNRVAPLYGFLTTHSPSGILTGQNYVFLQVKLNPQYFGTIKPNANSSSCCILRLDPDQFTVSLIAEIIMGTELIAVESMYGVDIVFYNSSEVAGSVPMIKVYFDSSWITFSQNTPCTPQNSPCTPISYPYSIALISDFYNFAAAYNLEITFNISASEISFSGAGIQDITLDMYTSNNYNFYNSSVNYSFNAFCGPIASSHQHNTVSETGSIFLITENDIITNSKQITNNYHTVMQVIDLAEQANGTTLAGCILMMGTRNLTFYLKYNLTWMTELTVIDAPQQNCLYFVNKIVNETAVQLGSDCYNPNVNTPTITVNYPNKTSPPSFSFGKIQIPMQLRDIVSVIQPNQTILIGIQQGPSKSVSGVLFMCNISVCNALTIVSKVVFFIDFDHQLTPSGLIIIGLDVNIVSIWVDPTINSNGSPIQTNSTINYYDILGYSCSKVKIVSISPTTANVILSCPSGLQQVVLNYGSNTAPPLSKVMTFTKFANCQAIDRFKPQFILEQDTNNIIFMAVQCQQNVDVVRIEEVYSLNSNNSVPIVTGYLMVFTTTGPQCSPYNWNPVRMINLGTSQESSSYNIYYADGQYKLLYGQINGILIDSFISIQPNTYYELIKLAENINYPSVTMSIKNPYYEIQLMIDTAPQKIPIPPIIRYLIIAIFIFFNATTIAFLLCWCLFRKNVSRHRNRLFETSIDAKIIINSPSRLNPSHFVSHQDSMYSSEQPKNDQRGSAINQQRPSILLPSNMKRKGTEIQLFQPR